MFISWLTAEQQELRQFLRHQTDAHLRHARGVCGSQSGRPGASSQKFNFKLHLLRCVGAGDRNSQFLTTHIFRLMMAQLCKLVNSGQSKVIPRSDLHRECALD